MRKDQRGYTLIEVLMVVLIIGVLSSLVIPRYFGQNERGYVAEAISNLSALRQAEVAYNLENSVAYTSTISALDVSITSTKFAYTVTTASSLLTATRSGGAAAYSGTTITLGIDTGTWGGTHPYKPNN